MNCQEVMKRSVECLSSTETVETAARRMRDANIGFLPVCDAARRVIGALTDRDIAIRSVAEGKSGSTPVERVMSGAPIVSCAPSDDIAQALELMSRHHVSRILCLENGKLAGVISLSDLAQKDGAAAVQTMREVTRREARV